MDKSEKQVSSLPPQQGIDKPAKDIAVPVDVYKPDHQVDMALFPLRFVIKKPRPWLRRHEAGMKADTLDGLKQVLTGNTICIQEFSIASQF